MRWELPALGAVGVFLWIDALLGGDLAGNVVCLAFVVGLVVLAGWGSRFPELLFTGLVVAGLLTIANQVASPGEFSFANDGIFYAVIVLAPALTGWLLGTRGRQLAELRLRTTELERHRATAIAATRVEEAERVETQVDLALAERLDEIVDGLRRAARLDVSDPGAVPEVLARVEETAREALGELREVLGALQSGESREAAVTSTLGPPDRRRRPDRYDVLLLLAVLPLVLETTQAGHRGPVWLNVVACLGQGLLLCVVRRRPLVGSAALFALAVLQTAWLTPLAPTVSWMLPGLLVPFLSGKALPRRGAPLGLGLLLFGFAAVSFATPDVHRELDGVLPTMVMIGLAWLAGRSLSVREARTAALRRAVDELARTRDDQLRLVAYEQRAAMVRDLHDVGAHALTVVCLQAAAAQKLWGSDRVRARTALTALRGLADGPLSHLGDSLVDRVPDETRHPMDAGMLEALAGLAKALGVEAVFEVHGEPRILDRDVARAVFRVVQEALTNAARYAAYTVVTVGLDYTVDALEVRISDSGPGQVPGVGTANSLVEVGGSGSGLRGMRERVEACHGELSSGPSGTGFAVLARLPLEAVS